METELVLWYIYVGLVVIWSIKFALIAITISLIVTVIKKVASGTPLGFWTPLVFEIIVTEMVATWRNFRRPASEKVDPNLWPRWKVIATLEAASNEIFHCVMDCDSVPIGDPLNPHTSVVYMVGVKKHAVFWRTFTIWRVSTVTGRREYVNHYEYINYGPSFVPGQEESFEVRAFCSRGVVFAHVRDKRRFTPELTLVCAVLLVYDARYKKWTWFSLYPIGLLNHWPNVILCMGRRIEQGKFDGWQIRLVTTAYDNYDDWRKIMVKSTIRLPMSGSRSPEIIKQEELLLPTSVARYRYLRSSAHHFGVCQESENGQRHVFLFDAKTDRFEMFATLENFLSSDASLWDYAYNRFDNLDSYLRDSNPMVLNGREAIQIAWGNTNDVLITRTWLATPTLMMSSIRSLMVGIPDLASMSAKEFRELSGVDLRGE